MHVWVAHMVYGAPNAYLTPVGVRGTYIALYTFGLVAMGHPIHVWGKIHIWSITVTYCDVIK